MATVKNSKVSTNFQVKFELNSNFDEFFFFPLGPEDLSQFVNWTYVSLSKFAQRNHCTRSASYNFNEIERFDDSYWLHNCDSLEQRTNESNELQKKDP